MKRKDEEGRIHLKLQPLPPELTDTEMHFVRRVVDASEAYLRHATKDKDLAEATPEYKRGYAQGLRESMAVFLELMLRECRRCFHGPKR